MPRSRGARRAGSAPLALLGVVAAGACGEAAPPRDAEPAPEPRVPPGAAGELRAFGTEPFWSVTVGADSIWLLDMAVGDTVAWPAAEPISAAARPPELARAWILDGGPPVVLVVRRVEEGCSDGMSDDVYPWRAQFLRGDRLYDGCARATTEGAGPPP